MSQWKAINRKGRALHEFKPAGKFQIHLNKNDEVYVMKESSGWYKGQVVASGMKGIFPVSFIQLTAETILPSHPKPLTITPEQCPAHSSPTSTITATSPSPSPSTITATATSATAIPPERPRPVLHAPEKSRISTDQDSADGVADSRNQRPMEDVKDIPTDSSSPSQRMMQHVKLHSPKAGSVFVHPSPKAASKYPSSPSNRSKLAPSPRANGSTSSSTGKLEIHLPPDQSVTAHQNQNHSPNNANVTRAHVNHLGVPPEVNHAGKNGGLVVSPGALLRKLKDHSPGMIQRVPPPLANFQPAGLTEKNLSHIQPAGLSNKIDGINMQNKLEPLTTLEMPSGFAELCASSSPQSKDDEKSFNMSEDALVREVGACIKEWTREMLQSLLPADHAAGHGQTQSLTLYHQLSSRISAVLVLRRELLDSATPPHRKVSLCQEIHAYIERSRKKLEGYVVVRGPDGSAATADSTGSLALLGLHQGMSRTIEHNDLRRASYVKQAQPTSTSAGSSSNGQEATPSRPGEVAGPATSTSTSLENMKGYLQLFVNVKAIIYSVGEETELFFNLWSEVKKSWITEAYHTTITREGIPKNIQLLHKMRAVFQDLEPTDFNGGLYLVCRIYRNGRLTMDPRKGGGRRAGSSTYRRPYAAAVLNLSEVGLLEKLGTVIDIDPKNGMSIYIANNEADFPSLHHLILKKDKSVSIPPQAQGIALSLALLPGTLAEAQALPNSPIDADAMITHRLFFPDFILPGMARNDFYLVLGTAIYLQDKKTSQKNVEILIQIRRSNGQLVERCLQKGIGSEPETEYRSCVYYHNNNPTYNEVVGCALDPAIFQQCHVLLFFSHISTSSSAKKNPPFSFSFLPLASPEGAVVENLEHKLQMYKMPSKLDEGKDQVDTEYLKHSSERQVRKGEVLGVETRLCSTVKTHNATLQSIFNWKDCSPTQLLALLESFTDLGKGLLTIELAKFVKKAFDVFFAILSAEDFASCHMAVFHAILHSLSLLVDKKLLKYRPLVDSYLSQFQNPHMHVKLLKLLGIQLDQDSPDKNFMSLTKCINYVFKFVVASRFADLKANNVTNTSEAAFKATTVAVLAKLNGMMKEVPEKKKGVYLLPSQTYTARNYPEVVAELESIFPPADLSALVVDMLESMGHQEKQNILKLTFMRSVLEGVVMREFPGRAGFVPRALEVVEAHLSSIESGQLSEPYLCVAILMSLFKVQQRRPPHTEKKDNAREALLWDFTPLLLPYLNMLRQIQQHNAGEVKLSPPHEAVTSTCTVDLTLDPYMALLAMLEAISPSQLTQLLQSVLPVSKAFESIIQLLESLKGMLENKLFPAQWTAMNAYLLQTVHRTLRALIPFMLASLDDSSIQIQPPVSPFSSSFSSSSSSSQIQPFSHSLPNSSPSLSSSPTFSSVISQHALPLQDAWTALFGTAFCLLHSEFLQLERFGEKKRNFIEAKYGDMRLALVDDARAWWRQLPGKYRLLLLPIVPELFDLLLSLEHFAPARQLSMDLYFDLVCQEKLTTGHFSQMERHTVDSLNNFAQQASQVSEDGKKTSEFVTWFEKDIRARFSRVPEIAQAGQAFMDHAMHMYELITQLLKLQNTDSEDERTTVALEILSYLSGTANSTRRDMYMQYTQILIELHEHLGNFLEAGLVTLGCTQLLDWSNKPLQKLGKYPSELERERKEHMLQLALAFFRKAEDWERAIQVCVLLRHYYSKLVFRYDDMTLTLNQEANFYINIIQKERFYSNYFKVTYYGNFPPEIAGKEYVYKGVPLEPVMDFVARVKTWFPDALVSVSAKAPTEASLDINKRIISVVLLTVPTQQERHELMSGWEHPKNRYKAEARLAPLVSVDVKIQRYLDNDGLQCFSYSIADQRGGKNPANEFKDLWVKKTFIFTEDPFPSNRRRIEVVHQKVVPVTPIENAIETTRNKTLEFAAKIHMVLEASDEKSLDLNPLTMALNGILDAAVNGGAKKYTDAFLSEVYLKDNPTHGVFQKDLKQALRHQLEALKKGLGVFGERCGESYEGLHEHLKRQYGQMRETMKDLLQ